MSCRGGPLLSSATPEVDDIDGFRFVAFERAEEMDNYLKQCVQRRRPVPGRQNAGKMKRKAGESPTNYVAASRTSPSSAKSKTKQNKVSKLAKTAASDSGKKRSLLWKHKKRLRKNDKRVVVDKVHGFVFASAFTVDDFDKFELEMVDQVSPSDSGAMKVVKRKSTSPPMTPLTAPKKTKEKNSHEIPGKFGKISDRGDLGNSNQEFSGSSKPDGNISAKHTGKIRSKHAGKIRSKHAGKIPPKHAGKIPPKHAGKIHAKHAGKRDKVYPLSKSGLDRLKKLNLSVLNLNEAKAGHNEGVAHGRSEPALDPLKNGPVETLLKKRKKKGKQFPHMQIDNPVCDRIDISSDSDESMIIISDVEDNTYLDVCGIDNDSSSAQFIRNSIKESEEKEAEQDLAEEMTAKPDQDDKGKPKKKKKCKMCCAHPCRIVEAKKVSPLWDSAFPSYNVWCVTTCKLHPPGEIIVCPSPTKNGFIDTCIQTTASDIKMHQDFAQRFPHRTIAVATRGPRVSDVSKRKLITHARPLSPTKSENHRSSEQKRREMMHGSFIELRQVINISQAVPDQERASKQWILEHAKKVVASLEAEGILLSALHKTLEVRNARLKKRWKELSGKDFDPDVMKAPPERPSQTKLMNLYKKYRQNVQKESSSETNAESPGIAKKSRSNPQEGQQLSQDRATAPIPSLCTLVNKLGPASEAILVTRQQSQSTSVRNSSPADDGKSSQVTTTSQASPATVSKCSDDAATSKPSPATAVNKPTEAVAASEPSQATSESKWSHAEAANKPSQVMAKSSQAKPPVTIPNQAIVANKPSQARVVLMPSQATTPSIALSSQTATMRMPIQSVAVNNPGQPPIMPNQAMTLKKPNQAPMLRIPIPGRAITLKIPHTRAAMEMVSRIIAMKSPRQATPVSIPGQVIALSQPSHLIALNNRSQVMAASKPTQWTAVGNIIPPTVNITPVEEIGAIVEVDGTSDEESEGKIVLLDVAETEDKQATSTSPEQARTVSLISTSSSINVTLNSVGSITSNKVFNKKAVPSKSPITLPRISNQKPTSSQKTLPESGVSKQPIEAKLSVCSPPGPSFGQVPAISDNLLAETFQSDGKNAINSTNEPGLCIISNVFSLSDGKPGETLNHNPMTGVGILNNIQNQVHSSLDVLNSVRYSNPGNGKQLGCHVEENSTNSTTHDHNYYTTRYKFILPRNTR